MKTHLLRLLALTLALTFTGRLLAQQGQGPAVIPPAADKPAKEVPAEGEKPKKKAPPKSMPFRGKVEAVDAKAMTVSLAGKEKSRVFHVTSKTRLEKDGKPATFGDIKPGDYARGSFERTPDGDNLLKATFGPAPEAGAEKKGQEEGDTAGGEKPAKKKPAKKKAEEQ